MELDIERRRKSNRDYYLRNRDRIKSRQREYYMTHKDKYKEYDAAYFQKNKKRMMEQNKIWCEKNRDKNRIIKRAYKYRKREEVRKTSRMRAKQIRLLLFDILGGRKCIRCGYDIDWRALTFDHIRDDGKEDRQIHYSAYGFYVFYTNNPDIARANLQVLCCNCNEIKKYDLMGYTKDL